MEKFKEYKYVDFYSSDEAGKSKPWTRIELSKVKEYQAKANNFNCFATVQRFKSAEQVRGEAYIAPLYFDLDFSEDPGVAQKEALLIIDFFTKELDLFESDIEIFFSGSKGFHVLINPFSLGSDPRPDLHKIFKHIAGYLKFRLTEEGLKSLDLVVYTSKRMLRLENSVHHKTRLFKIRLTKNELETLTLEEIKKLATKPRQDISQNVSIGIREKAAYFYQNKLQEYLEAKRTSESSYNEEYNFKDSEPPVCVQDILQNGWKKDGDRNQATVQLACYFKDANYSKEKTIEVLTDWVKRFTSAKTNYSISQRIANTRSVIETIYSQDNEYKFGCAFIRSLHGPKSPNSLDYDRVKCAGDLCVCLKRNSDEEIEKAPKLHLSATGDAQYDGKLIKTDVMVAGKKHTPYIVPRRVEYSCWGADKCKNGFCPLKSVPNNTAYLDLGVHNRELIQMCGVGDDNVIGILRKLAGTPNCKKFNVNVEDTTNVEELLVIPKVETNIIDDIEGRYVLTKVYVIDNISLEENKYYELTGYVYSHPKNQEATIMVKEAKPLQDAIQNFKLTEEIKQELKVFKPKEWTIQGIAEKLQSIINHLSYNVTQMVERDEVHLGVLLVLHSVLNFMVPWDNNPIRGWLETVIIGDTGTGKSTLIEKLLEYVELGTRVNAESTSRTGLAYKMEQSGIGNWYITWGAWPLADKKIIWIDEASSIPKEEYARMTMARSSGKLEVKRAVTAETTCRVRAILSGNVVNGKRLSDYTQGVESLKEIFNNEDIRRFDFGIFMKTTDVDSEKYNCELPIYPQVITAENLRNNILFAWSRTYDQVEFTEETKEKILEVATELSKIYGKASDVPLVSPSDQRNKIARLATALAILTNSVDDSGERVIVRDCHAEFILHYLKEVYNAPGCRLNYYAKLAINDAEVDDEGFQKITKILKSIKTLQDINGKTSHKFMSFILLFQQQKYLHFADVEAMLGIDKEEAKEIIMKLVKLRMLIKTSGGYKKTSRFNSYISKCFENGQFDDIDLDYL